MPDGDRAPEQGRPDQGREQDAAAENAKAGLERGPTHGFVTLARRFRGVNRGAPIYDGGQRGADMSQPQQLPIHSGMIDFIDAVFFHLNVGLLIYHVPNPDDIPSYRLIYANTEASRYTGTDLSGMIGQTIFEAFPKLVETPIPEAFRAVIKSGQPRGLGQLEYADEHVRRATYRSKAFPMPSQCLGVIFESVARPEP